MIVYKCKTDRRTMQLLEKAMKKLNSQIAQIEQGGTPFEKIFNNDSIKYDVLGKGFFTYKYRGADSSQLRVLYKFIRKNKNLYDIEVHKVVVKRRSGKEYIKEFEDYVDSL